MSSTIKGPVWPDSTEQEIGLRSLIHERRFQDGKFGVIGHGGEHTLGEWVLLIEAELAEVKLALIKGGEGRNSVRSELTQVGALVLAALEQHGVVDPHNGRQV